MIANYVVSCYYTVLIGLAIHYLFASFSSILPWTVCDDQVILENITCIASGLSGNGNTQLISSSEQYFLHSVLKHKESIEDGIGLPDLSLLGCQTLCYAILLLSLWRGVKSSGKAAYFFAIFPYIVLITLLVRGCTLPGAMKGIMYLLNPKWSALLDIKVWYAAATQAFYSLAIGYGSIINYSSYNKFNHNIYRDAIIVSCMDACTSTLAGLTIFSILGNLAHELGAPISEVTKGGVSLAFVSYPTAIGKFTFVPQLFSVIFFLMLATLGMGSATAVFSAIVAIVCDAKPKWNRLYVTMVILGSCYFFSLVFITPVNIQQCD